MIWSLARELGKFPHEIENELEAWELVEYAVLVKQEGKRIRKGR